MKFGEQIEHLEHWWTDSERPWKNWSRSRKDQKRLQHRSWRHWSKQHLDEESNNPAYNRYNGWEW